MAEIGTIHYLVLAAALFVIGIAGVLTRRNVVIILMSIELILNAVNLNLIAFTRLWNIDGRSLDGQVFAMFIVADAAAEAAVGPRSASSRASGAVRDRRRLADPHLLDRLHGARGGYYRFFGYLNLFMFSMLTLAAAVRRRAASRRRFRCTSGCRTRWKARRRSRR
jgi:NADH-quinone oxidoreductase subunit K